MHQQDLKEAEQRRRAAAFTMRLARRRYRRDRAAGAARDSFRAWARRTYNPEACTGKLARIVVRKDS